MKKTFLYMLLIILCPPTWACTESATKLNKQAQLALNVANYDEAMTLLKKAVSLEPENVATRYLLGMCFAAKGQLVEAISEYKKVLDVAPNNIFTICLLANAYSSKGMSEEAITLYQKAIALDPESELAHYSLGIAYKKQGKNTIAARHLFEAGLLAFIQSKKNLAVKSYRALEEIGPTQTTQELYELLEPILTSDSNPVNPSP